MRLAVTTIVPRHRVGVGVVCIDEAGRILLLQHVFHPHYQWGLPGGWLNRREAPTPAAARELLEETGLQVEIGMPVYVGRSPLSMGIEIVFLATVIAGKIRLSHEILDYCWADATALPQLPPASNIAIKNALAMI